MIFLILKKGTLIYRKLISSTILFYSFLYHTDALADVTDYCFNRSVSLNAVHDHLKVVLSPHDEVIENSSSHCLNVVMKGQHKDELYRKWIAKKFKISTTSLNSTLSDDPALRPQHREHCRLEVQRKSKTDRQTVEASLSKRSKLNERTYKHSGSQVSSLLLGIGKPGSLRVDSDYLNVICKSQNSSRVFLDISLSGVKSSVSTSITLEKGQTINLASIVEDLNDKYERVSLKKGISVMNRKGKKTYDYFLKIKE